MPVKAQVYYLRRMSLKLASVAAEENLPVLAYLYEMARLEADRVYESLDQSVEQPKFDH
jgi:hypothetical protein